MAAASLALVWLLSPNALGLLLALRVAAFGVFIVAAWTLLAAVLIDFDRWVDTVPPVPKRIVRRAVVRVARATGRVLARTLAWYGLVMTWLWSAALRVVVWALSRSGVAVTKTWTWSTRVGIRSLILYRAAMTLLWHAVARGASWTLRVTGAAVISAWIGLTRAGTWALIRYRTAMTTLWHAVAVAVTRTLRAVGTALTRTWISFSDAGTWTIARYRDAMTRLWNAVVLVVAWAIVNVGDPIGSAWTWAATQAVALPARGAAAVRPLRTIAVRRRTAANGTERSWYHSAVDVAFGIPPRDAPDREVVDLPARAATRDADTRRGLRPPRRAGAVTPPSRSGTRRPVPQKGASQMRYVGRGTTRRQHRGGSEDLLASALHRLRSIGQLRDRGRDG
jgi:hypothetical protein